MGIPESSEIASLPSQCSAGFGGKPLLDNQNYYIIIIDYCLLIIDGWYCLYIEVSFGNLSKNGIGAKRGWTDFVGWAIQHQFDAFGVVLQVPKRTSGHSSWSQYGGSFLFHLIATHSFQTHSFFVFLNLICGTLILDYSQIYLFENE